MPDQSRRYFDNAATSHPKPPEVPAAVLDYFSNVHASAGRGAYSEALQSARILAECRAACAALFHASPADHVIFTFNGTDALNLGLKGVLRPDDHVVTTTLDHNSVLRPLAALASRADVTWSAVPVDPETTLLRPENLAAALRPNTRLVALNHASNVTGALQPLGEIAALCRSRGVLLLVDAAQSAGHVPIDLQRTPIDLLACPGHKGLLGPLGTGLLVIRAGVERQMRTVREGGTGSASERPVQPDELPDRFEAGSHNAPGIAGLLAAVRWISARGVAALRAHEELLCRRFMQRLVEIPALTWFGPRASTQRVGVFSVRVPGLTPGRLGSLLEEHFGLLTRSGVHCAPLAHESLGTLASGGTTRFSFSAFTSEPDVETAADALAAIVREHCGAAPLLAR